MSEPTSRADAEGRSAAGAPSRTAEGAPLVSVVIPTHNRRDLVCEAIDSALSQTYPAVEVIVVDDASTDDTVAHLRERYADRIQVVELDELSGAAAARNAGVAVSSGAFLSFLDSDDVWLPEKLDAQMEVMLEGGESVALVGGACEYFDLQGNARLKPSMTPDSATYEDFCISIKLPGSGSNNLVRREAFEAVGGFDERLIRAQDKDLWIRLLEDHEVRYTREVTARIRIHDTARVGVDPDVIIRCRRAVDEKIRDPAVRRKATAWSYFSFFRLLWPERPGRAMRYLMLSFLTHPRLIRDDLRRLRPAARQIFYSLKGEG